MTHFLLTTMFSAGDVVPFARLGAQLHARGHRVTLVTHESYRHLAQDAGIGFGSWDTPDEHARLMADGELFNDIAGFTTMYERHVIPKLAREVAALSDNSDADTVMVTRCGPAIAARVVAERRDIPLVEVFLGPGHVSPTDILAEFARPFSQAITALRGAGSVHDAWVVGCNARLGLWPTWFAPPEAHWPPGLELTGFVSGEAMQYAGGDPALAALLESSQRTILLASGTGRFLNRDVVEACAQAALRVGATLLIVTPFADLVPDPIPDHVRWYRFAPYGYVVPRTSLLIHHGGIGTAHDGLRAGVPQIILGTGGDRPVNASCLQRLEVGRYVPPAKWSADAIASAAQALLGSERTQHACSDLAARLRSDPGDQAVKVLEALPPIGFAARLAQTPDPAPRADIDEPLRARLGKLSPSQRALVLQRLKKRDS